MDMTELNKRALLFAFFRSQSFSVQIFCRWLFVVIQLRSWLFSRSSVVVPITY